MSAYHRDASGSSWDPFDHSEGQFGLNVTKFEKRCRNMGSRGLLAAGRKNVRVKVKKGLSLEKVNFELVFNSFLPCPSFPCSFWKQARQTTKKTRIFYPYRTPKIPGKEARNAQKSKDSSQGEKTRNSQKKTRKEGQGDFSPPRGTHISRLFWDFSHSGRIAPLNGLLG